MSANRNRTAGHTWERELAKLFNSLGYPHVVTSRSESRSRDDQKVDLINKDERKNGQFVYNVQAKNMIGHVKYAKLLSELPREDGIINIVVHKQTEKQGTRFLARGAYAIMELTDLVVLLSTLQKSGIIITPELIKSFNERLHNGENTIGA